jgi:hypothetical protein
VTVAATCSAPGCSRSANGSGRYCDPHAYHFGTTRPLVVAAPVVSHLRACIAAGATAGGIAAGTGVSYRWVTRLTRDPSPEKIRADTADLLLSATPGMTGGHAPTWPLTRRVRALAAAGHRYVDIARAAGLTAEQVARLANQPPAWVMPKTDRAVREVYARMSRLPVKKPNPRIRRHGWVVPYYWNDIDDPSEWHCGCPTVSVSSKSAA